MIYEANNPQVGVTTEVISQLESLFCQIEGMRFELKYFSSPTGTTGNELIPSLPQED